MVQDTIRIYAGRQLSEFRGHHTYYAVRKHGYTIVRTAPFVGKALALAQNRRVVSPGPL